MAKNELSKVLRKLHRIKWVLRPKVLLSGRIPEPMHGLAPRVVLGNKWWQETRKAAYRSTAYHCVACGVHKADAKGRKWLEAHEMYEVDYLLGRMVYVETVPLCHYCHNFIHAGRLAALLEEGKISHQKYAAIIQHGLKVLAEAGLAAPKPYEGLMAEAKDWRLVIDGQEYKNDCA